MTNTAPSRGVDVAGWLGEGWRLYKKEPAVFSLSAAIIGIILLFSSRIPTLVFFVSRPLILGFYLIVSDMEAGKPFSPERIFKGFAWFLPCLAAEFLISVFSIIGFVFLIIPGLIVSSWYMFTWLFMLDRGLGFWEAMEASRKLASPDKTGIFLFYISLIAVNIAGALCLGVGLLVSLPVSALAIWAAYRELAGLNSLAPGNPAPETGL